MSATALPALPRQRHSRTLIMLSVWFGIVAFLGYRGAFVTETGELPLLLFGSGVFVLVLFALGYRTSLAFRDYVLGLDKRLLILLHSWRTLGLGFVLVYSVGALPALFAFPAGIGDAVAAIWATFLAYSMLVKKSAVSNRQILTWNTFGLVDFVIALGLGVLTRTDAVFSGMTDVSGDVLMTFPFVIVPAFLVQFFTLTHIIIYLQIRNERQEGVTLSREGAEK